MKYGMNLMWKIGKLEIEREVRKVCEGVFKEYGKNKSDRKKLSEALKKVGELFYNAGKKAGGGNKNIPDIESLMGGAAAKARQTEAEHADD